MIKKLVLQNFILPLGDRLSFQCVMKHYKLLSEAQWWPQEQLYAYQNKLLRQTITTAYEKTKFYRALFEERGIKPKEIGSVHELHKIPIVTKDMLRKAYPKYCTVRTKWPWHEFFTSGSTGRPFAVRVNNYSLSIARALMILRANFSGWEIGDKYLQTGMSLKRGIIRKAKDILLNAEYVSAFDLSNAALNRILELIEHKNIKYIMGYASSLFCIAKHADKTGFNNVIRGAVSWGDNLFPHYRRVIEKTFKCRVTDTYGCGEGIQISAQCGMNDGAYHIFEPHVVVEFVDKDGYVEPGELGDIVVTRLDPGAMPLIRYKLGDVGRPDRENIKCECGRSYRTMRKIEGRDSDIVHTPNGNRLIVHFFTGIFEYYQSVDTFQVEQNVLEKILVRIVPNKDFNVKDWERIKREILEKGDRDLKIEMELVNQIPIQKSGKRRFVISTIET